MESCERPETSSHNTLSKIGLLNVKVLVENHTYLNHSVAFLVYLESRGFCVFYVAFISYFGLLQETIITIARLNAFVATKDTCIFLNETEILAAIARRYIVKPFQHLFQSLMLSWLSTLERRMKLSVQRIRQFSHFSCTTNQSGLMPVKLKVRWKFIFRGLSGVSLSYHPKGFQNVLPLTCALSLTSIICCLVPQSEMGSVWSFYKYKWHECTNRRLPDIPQFDELDLTLVCILYIDVLICLLR